MIVFSLLRENGYVDGSFNCILEGVNVWAEKSSNKKLNKLLSSASKKGTGNAGYPEYLILDEENNLVIVIENKKSIGKHLFEPLGEKVNDYAVNGALHYAKIIKEEYDTIAIGISGSRADSLKIDTFGWKKKSESFNNFNKRSLFPIGVYLDLLKKSNAERSSKESVVSLNSQAKAINEFLRDVLSVIEHERLYVLGSILYALEDHVFRVSYSHCNSPEQISLLLYQTVVRKVKGSNVKEKDVIINELKPVLSSLGVQEKEGVREEYPNGALLELIKNVDLILFEFHRHREIDLMSTFFNVFLSYSTSGGSDLGIVLTPPHITNLFCDLAGVNIESKVLDICVGTGGFLTSAWRKIALNDSIEDKKKELFRTSNIFGVEKERNIYTIVALNMFINKDGKSNLYWGDAFSLQSELKELDCNVGFINPPYSDSIYSEMSFVEVMLDSLLPNSIGVAIVPVNAVSSRTKKHPDMTSIKRRVLNKHSLIASLQMPLQLFYPKGTETVILVFRTGVPNNEDTWLAKFDDGYELIKHQKSRTPTASSHKKYQNVINAYTEKDKTDFSLNKQMSEDDQWVYTLHQDVNYEIKDSDLQDTVNEFISYLFQNGYF